MRKEIKAARGADVNKNGGNVEKRMGLSKILNERNKTNKKSNFGFYRRRKVRVFDVVLLNRI